ncbi:MAG: trimethylamine methyltransferase family protein [Chloroflexi bacterium]|nr:trimethylamine methyltransferase family protein [Chloroflexota bacterium]
MNSGFRSQVVPSYRLLTEEQIKEIHLASLDILETIGMRVMNEEGVQLLRDAGCRVTGKDVCHIPAWLVEDCIRSAPPRFTVYNRNGEEAMNIGGRHINFGLGTDLINTYDLETGEMHESVLQDVANAAKVADYCEEVNFVASYALPHDVPVNSMYIECFRTQMENTVKPIFFTAAGYEDLSIMIEMAAAVAGGEDKLRAKPFLIHYSEPTAPLQHSYGAVRKLFLCAEKGIPINYTPGDIMGGSTPITLAGGIAQANAEGLSSIVLHQLKAKGAPIICGFAAVPLDMKTATFSYGAPDFRLTNSASSDLYHYYDIPMWSTIGTDSHVFDQQASMEHVFGILLAALDGSNLIHDIGYLGQGLVGNPAMIVMDNEIISYVKRILRGFDITPETLALNIMREVGPGGQFMTTDHTLEFYKQEQWRTQLISRDEPASWIAKGKLSYGERVTQKTIEILKTHKPQPLPDDVRKKVDTIAKNAQKTLEGMTFTA